MIQVVVPVVGEHKDGFDGRTPTVATKKQRYAQYGFSRRLKCICTGLNEVCEGEVTRCHSETRAKIKSLFFEVIRVSELGILHILRMPTSSKKQEN